MNPVTEALRSSGRCTTCGGKFDERPHVHLIGVLGWVPAKKARDVRRGDMPVYNYNQRAIVLSDPEQRGKSVYYRVRSLSGSGGEYDVRKGAETLVPYSEAARPEQVEQVLRGE